MRRLAVAVAAVCLVPAAASAHEVGLSGSGSLGEKSAASPRTGLVGGRVEGSVDVGDVWTVDVGAAFTHELSSKPDAGAAFRPKGGNVFSLAASLGRLFGTHLYTDLGLSFSPPSTTESTTTVAIADLGGAPADALIAARTNTLGGTLLASWDSGAMGGLRWRLLGLGTVDRTATEQAVSKLATAAGEVNVTKLATSCAKGSSAAACDRLGPLAQPVTSSLWHGAAMVGLTLRFGGVHEASVGATWHGYSQDAAKTAYFSLSQTGRGTFSLGGGVPVSPLRAEGSAGYARELGPVKLGLTANGGAYATGGSTLGLTLRATWKVSDAWRIWVRSTASRDVDADGAVLRSGLAAMGLGYSWEAEEPVDDADDEDEPS